MSESTGVVLAFCTFPDRDQARTIGRTLVEERLAACVNIGTSPVDSIYWWDGKLDESSEVLAIFKLPSAGFERFASRLRSLHPYEVPEIICVDIAKGSEDYLRWVLENTVNCGVK